jgi:hypothetical protein
MTKALVPSVKLGKCPVCFEIALKHSGERPTLEYSLDHDALKQREVDYGISRAILPKLSAI